MVISNERDLGKAFQKLKNDLLECERQVGDKEKEPDLAKRYAGAYGSLSAMVQHHICWNTDLSFSQLGNEMIEARTPDPDDIPTSLFQKPGIVNDYQ